MDQLRIKIRGMMCSFCTQTIEKAMGKLSGVESVKVNLAHEEALIQYRNEVISKTGIITKLEDLGYEAWDPADENKTHRISEVKYGEKPRLILSGYVALNVMISMLLMFTLNIKSLSMDFMLLVIDTLMIFAVGWPILKMSYYALRQGILNQHVLLSYGAVGGYVSSILAIFFPITSFAGLGAMLIFAHVLSGFVSSAVKDKASNAVKKLLELQPPNARVINNGAEKMVPVKEIQVGDLVLVKPGEKIPIDGIIIEGATTIDESLVTGESMPVDKDTGDEVIGATLNINGLLTIKASKVGSDTVLAGIARFVEESKMMKPPIVLLADKVLKYYVPGVMLISVASFFVWIFFSTPVNALFAALSVAVIGYPCALGLSTPLALMRGTGIGAEHGILIKSGVAFQRLKDIRTIVFDKTGTLTIGKPEVTDIITAGIEDDGLLSIAASVEQGSEHPLGMAILAKAESRGLELQKVKNFKAVSGTGVTATVDGKNISIGKFSFYKDDYNIDDDLGETALNLEKQGKTVVAVAIETKVTGLFAFLDIPKKNTSSVIETLKRKGFRTAVLSGDNRETVKTVSKELGIDDFIAEVPPWEKAENVRLLQKKEEVTMMVGDGINDAPALAQADVGVAMGTGTDIAMESADIVILGDDLSLVPESIRIGKSTYGKIKQNLLWAFFFNAVGIPVAASGFMHPTIAITAMALSTIGILLNSLHIKTGIFPGKTTTIPHGKHEDVKKINIKISNIKCSACIENIKLAFSGESGVKEVTGNPETKEVTIIYLSQKTNNVEILGTIINSGYIVV